MYIIVGGGITGLSAAWELQRQGIEYTLLESSNRWGGKIISTNIELPNDLRCLTDGGPDTIVTRKAEAWDLADELGILDLVENPGSETRDIYVLDGGVIQPVPLSPSQFIRSRLMTTRGKLRLLAEPFQPARRDDEDESLADFAERRLGREAMEKFIGPVLGGIYNTDPRTQSILVSSPVMREMEKESGGLFLGALQRGLRKKPKDASGMKKPRFITFKNGVQGLVGALAGRLSGNLRLNAGVKTIMRTRDGYQVLLVNGESINATGVISATLANVSAGILAEAAPEASQKLANIQHNHIGTVSLVYREEELPKNPVINGLMIPRRENRQIDAITFTSRKSPHRAAPGYALLRVFIGGARPEVVEYDDDRLMLAVRSELASLIGVRAEPQAHAIFRWPNGFPQANVGHLRRVDEIEKCLPSGIALAGSSYRGIAVPDCIRQGREAAHKIISTSQETK